MLRNDRRAIVQAAAHAERAVRYLHGLQPAERAVRYLHGLQPAERREAA